MKYARMSPICRSVAILIVCASTSLVAQLPVQLTVQEAIYPGASTSGINRTQDPVTVGIPIADNAGINSISQLGLQGALLGQFRVLGRWPSGNIEWVLVDTQADLHAGGKNTGISLTRGGTGNFGGAPLATDSGSTITVNTGTAVFTIRKANFNVFDQVVSGGKTLIASGSSQGLAVLGPANPGTSCNPGPCTTQYLSSNDRRSTAVIEENGPARAVIRADGIHCDATGNGYMRFTLRMHFYKDKTFVKLTTMLRNADEGASNTFNSAAKGFTSYELRLTPTLSSGRSFSFGKDTGTASGKFTGFENAYLYQAYSNDMEHPHWNGATCPYGSTVPRCVAPFITRTGKTAPYTYSQDGYQIVQGQNTLANGDHSHYPAGWADLTDSTGAGIEVGIYQMSSYWPKSLQFQNGGAEIRVGIWPDQSLSPVNPKAAIPYYQAWPQYSVHDLYLNFHTAPLSLRGTEFLKFQHYLMARAPIAHYNNANVFFYPLLDPVEEDSYWSGTSARYGFRWNGNSPAISDLTPKIFRLYAWRSPGGANQSEVRWGYIEQWVTRGLTGRYLTASHFYRYQAEQAFPRSDMNASGAASFRWRTHSPASDVDAYGFPANIQSANTVYVNRTWIDEEHAHWYGMGDYYFLTGDETVKDQMLDGIGDRFLNTSTLTGSGHLWNTRAVGAQLMGLARYRRFLGAIGDTADITPLDSVTDSTLYVSVFPELCVSSYPAGCTIVIAPSRGVSRTRGIADGGSDVGSDNNCAVGKGLNIRCAKPWMMAIQEEGMWEIARARGANWPNNRTGATNPYQLTLDLAYGMANWTSNEDFVSGTSYSNSSLKYDLAMDYPNPMATPTAGTDNLEQFEFNYFLLSQYQGNLTAAQQQQFELTYLHMAAGTSFNANNIDDHDMYISSALLQSTLHPWGSLSEVPLSVTHTGAGSYSLSWTAAAGAQLYRIKQASQPVVDWIGFNPKTNAFVGNPATSVNWFAASEVTPGNQNTCPPAPAATGTRQSCTISGLDPKQSWHFAMKAKLSSSSAGSLSVSIAAPQSGAALTGTVTVSATASSNTTVSGVQLLLDGAPLGSVLTIPPYTLDWNTNSATNGAHALVAQATDVSGNVANSIPVALTVGNTISNDPSVSITSPASNTTISGSVNISARVTASAKIAYVQFSLDGRSISPKLTAPPFSLSWSSSGSTDGTHSISVVAVDTSGRRGSASEPILVALSSSCGQGWCNTFPVTGVVSDKLTPPFGSSAWNKLNYIPDVGRFYIYTSDGIWTFANSWWSYGVLKTMADTNPWVEETTSGTIQATVTDNTKGFLNQALGPKGTTIALQPSQGATFHPDPVHGGVLVIDNEEIGYSAADLSGDIFTGISRGIRGTTAANHVIGSRVTGGAPFPQSRIEGALVPVLDHIPDRHPFLFSAYDTRRSQLFQVTGIVELNKLGDTWYLCMKESAYCPQADVKVWRRLQTPTNVVQKADGAMVYDSDDDVMILYGGQTTGSPTDDTWVLCFQADPQQSGNDVGCPTGHSYPDWVQVSTIPADGAGPRLFHTLVYDSYHKKVVLFGGNDGSETDPNTTWLYTPATRTWINANPSGRIPSAFRRPAMTYDSTRHVSVLYEGPLGVLTDGIPGGLYLYDAGSNVWTLTSVAGGPVPTTETTNPVCHGRLSIAYDSLTDTFVATELGPLAYVLYAWELPGTNIK
jgi:hypothetical protein